MYHVRRGLVPATKMRSFLKKTGSLPFQHRWKMSSILEPPLDCPVLEKPCTVVLLEDPWLYSHSWCETFQARIPTEHGMSFGSLHLENGGSFDGMLEELKVDLAGVQHDAVLVTRGPISSWAANFYLESFSLLGLVMVDPLTFDQPQQYHDEENTVQDVLVKEIETKNPAMDQDAHLSYLDLLHAASAKKLKLEPNPVPILVMQSIDRILFQRGCEQMAQRHSNGDGPFGQVVIKNVMDQDSQVIVKELDDWVESIL